MAQSVNNIIRDSQGKYLLQMRDGSEGICNPLLWNLFGGGLNGSDEEPLKAAVRELKEELGKDASENDFQLKGTVGEGEKMVYVFEYLSTVEWKDLVVQEGAGAGYFTKDEMLKIPITEKTKLILEKYL
ncbi:MAG: NUDIX domain-containing protein [Candidatus Moraniibacteriota bacterium]